MSQDLNVRALDSTDREQAVVVINTAAEWYREFLPPEEAAGPEITADDWDAEATRMIWYGAFAGNSLVGVMGAEYVRDVALLRHAYVLPRWQRQGVGSILRQHAESQISGVDRIIVGTYEANHKARNALEQAGYRLSEDSEAVNRSGMSRFVSIGDTDARGVRWQKQSNRRTRQPLAPAFWYLRTARGAKTAMMIATQMSA